MFRPFVDQKTFIMFPYDYSITTWSLPPVHKRNCVTFYLPLQDAEIVSKKISSLNLQPRHQHMGLEKVSIISLFFFRHDVNHIFFSIFINVNAKQSVSYRLAIVRAKRRIQQGKRRLNGNRAPHTYPCNISSLVYMVEILNRSNDCLGEQSHFFPKHHSS